jgi:MATE family multidrug resistance protein
MALTIMFIFGIVFLGGQSILPTLYVNDVDVIAIATPLLIIAGLFQLADGAQVVCAGALRGMQDVKIPSLLIFVAYWIIGLPLGYWLAFGLDMGSVGIWTGLLIGLMLTAIAMFLRLRYMTNKLIAEQMSVS